MANSESPLYLEGAGKHSKLGELIGRTVLKAVKRALAKQSGLTLECQHDVFRRLKRFGVIPQTMWQEYSKMTGATVKPEYLVAAEDLGKENMMLCMTSLYIHLLDQMLWKLISPNEMQEAGQQVLDNIAAVYGQEKEVITEPTLEGMLAAWKLLFNKLVAEKLSA